MPNCFQLTRKGEAEPIVLQKLDEELCQMLDVPCHPKWWCMGWYDIIGFSLAMGKTFEDISNMLLKYIVEDEEQYNFMGLYVDRQLFKINCYLFDNFTTDTWAEIGRRA